MAGYAGQIILDAAEIPHKALPAIAFQEKIKFIALIQTCQLPPKNSWESKLGFGMNQAGDCREVGEVSYPCQEPPCGKCTLLGKRGRAGVP